MHETCERGVCRMMRVSREVNWNGGWGQGADNDEVRGASRRVGDEEKRYLEVENDHCYRV